MEIIDILLTSDFKTVAAQNAAMLFPKTKFQVLSQEIGDGNIAITFKNPRHFSDNFRIKFYPQLKTLIISGYSPEGIVYLNYLPENNYDWHNGGGCIINKPSIGDKFEFLARKFYLILSEFFLGEVFDNFLISHEFETAATQVVVQTFPQY